ncbi:MAG: hypothetical protein ABT940_11905 [Alphaproteobacteria bacterium]
MSIENSLVGEPHSSGGPMGGADLQKARVGRPRSHFKRTMAIRFFAELGRLPEYDPPPGHPDYGVVRKAAVAADVDQKSIRNWLRDPEFRERALAAIDMAS